MTSRDYLQSVRLERVRLEGELESLEELRSLLQSVKGISYDKTRVQTSTPDTAMAGVDRLVDMEQELIRRIGDHSERCRTAVDMINRLHDPDEIRVLRHRYVRGERWKEVSDNLDLSESGVHKLHERALRDFEDVCQNPFSVSEKGTEKATT